MRERPRRAAVDKASPRAWATDQRSGFIGNLENMEKQYQWAGNKLVDTKLLVLPDMLDTPQRQLGSNIMSPDPLPIANARPGTGLAAEQVINVTANYTATAGDIIGCTGSFDITLPTALEINGQSVTANNNGTGSIGVIPILAQTISDAAVATVAAGDSLTVISDGANWEVWP